jgi:hypothetical protein
VSETEKWLVEVAAIFQIPVEVIEVETREKKLFRVFESRERVYVVEADTAGEAVEEVRSGETDGETTRLTYTSLPVEVGA